MFESIAIQVIAGVTIAAIVGILGWFLLLKKLEIKLSQLEEEFSKSFTSMDKRVVLLEEHLRQQTEINYSLRAELQIINVKFSNLLDNLDRLLPNK
ncbi:hypothetical protein VCO139_0064 [Vibrio phage VCO139]|uniref:Uncharacterized protein n=1 Tax=Vibrio phage VCO139 TaxID=1283073 RepID=R9R4W8_9CAUD|nr:hypothetical protein HYO77_gp40 [Vibrio phage VCO139]AGI61891.1 hypothetical protein VCO139_0064 [Vibrio phage VCO139]